MPNAVAVEGKSNAKNKANIPEFNPTGRRTPTPQANKQQNMPPKTSAQTTTSQKPKRQTSWHDFLRQVNSPIKAFLIPASTPKIENNNIYLNFPDKFNFHFEQLKTVKMNFVDLSLRFMAMTT